MVGERHVGVRVYRKTESGVDNHMRTELEVSREFEGYTLPT